MIEKFIAVGLDTWNGVNYHHVDGVRAVLNHGPLLSDGSESYKVIANIKLTVDEQTGKVLAVELIEEPKGENYES